MRRYVGLNEDGRIISTSDEKFSQEGQFIFEFPDDFNFFEQLNYKLVNNELVYDAFIPILNIEEQIEELKAKLKDSDYNILKIIEGEATSLDMKDVISQRKQWRKQINELEER